MEEFGEDRWRRMEMVLNMTRHEVQHRVTVAESYLELLRDNVTEKHRRRYLEKALKNVREVSRQMNLLQEYQEIGAGEPRWTELGALMERARAQAGLDQVEMQHDLHGLEVLADPLLESALMMFLEQEMRQTGTTRTGRHVPDRVPEPLAADRRRCPRCPGRAEGQPFRAGRALASRARCCTCCARC